MSTPIQRSERVLPRLEVNMGRVDLSGGCLLFVDPTALAQPNDAIANGSVFRFRKVTSSPNARVVMSEDQRPWLRIV